MLERKRFLTIAAGAALALSAFTTVAAPALAAGGQTGVIRGTVVDASNAALTGADVTLTAPTGRYTAHTDGHGKFVLVGVLADTYTLTVRKDGTVRISQPGVGVVGDDTVDLGTSIAPNPPSAGS
jgi:Carboxypeptidase regulatory-like domain